jgi:CheY-like chemotaxis protein
MPTKILAIDDSKTMRLAIKITFAAEDAKVTAVSKGSEAVARAKQMQADVILVDHKLGDGEPSGLEVVAALKANPATANIPVILLVPAKGGVNEAEITAAGADNYVGKPFDSQDLIDKVAASLGRAVAKPAAAAKPVAAPAAAKPAVVPAAAKPAPAAAAKPPAATPPVAAPPAAARKPVATPAVPAAAAKPVAVPAAAKPAPAAAAAKPVAAASAPAPARVPAATPAPTPVAARPAAAAAKPAAATPMAATPMTAAARAPAGGVPAQIPIAMPIPFTAANSPTPGMLERLKAAGGGAAAGLDPGAIRALLQLSHEVVEQIVWEVVPDLAEEIIKQKVR